jgi:hypothetical protein
MKTEFRRALAQQSFEEKIRKVSELIRLSRRVKTHRAGETAEDASDSPYRAGVGAKGRSVAR